MKISYVGKEDDKDADDGSDNNDANKSGSSSSKRPNSGSSCDYGLPMSPSDLVTEEEVDLIRFVLQ